MRTLLIALTVTLALTGSSYALESGEREMLEQVHLDALVIRRIAEVAGRDLPRDLLQRMVEQDIELLRGKQSDGSYRRARYEPIEAGRVSEGFTVRPGGEAGELDRDEFRAKNVFKLIVRLPSRRLLVARNRDIHLERIEIAYDDQDGRSKVETFEVGQHVEAGNSLEFDLPEVAADAVATVWARAERKTANMELIFVQAELVDDPGSVYFGVIQSAKLLQEAIERRDLTAMQSLASSITERLESWSSVTVPAPRPVEDDRLPRVEVLPEEPAARSDALLEVYLRLERIEDLLDGSPDEENEARERLHALIRELRAAALDATNR